MYFPSRHKSIVSLPFTDNNPKEQPPSYDAIIAAPAASTAASAAAEAGYSGANSRRSSTAEYQGRIV